MNGDEYGTIKNIEIGTEIMIKVVNGFVTFIKVRE